MNKDTVKTIFKIMATADGGCHVCVGRLFNRFLDTFGDRYIDLARDIYREEFNEELQRGEE